MSDKERLGNLKKIKRGDFNAGDTRARLADEIASALFVNGNGDQAERLRLVSAAGRDLGGWSLIGAIRRIEGCLEASAKEEA